MALSKTYLNVVFGQIIHIVHNQENITDLSGPYFLLNVFTALKGTHFYILFVFGIRSFLNLILLDSRSLLFLCVLRKGCINGIPWA